jgi:hypothetical protein
VFIQQGVPMLRDMEENIYLKFMKARTFSSGVVVLYYKLEQQ